MIHLHVNIRRHRRRRNRESAAFSLVEHTSEQIRNIFFIKKYYYTILRANKNVSTNVIRLAKQNNNDTTPLFTLFKFYFFYLRYIRSNIFLIFLSKKMS